MVTKNTYTTSLKIPEGITVDLKGVTFIIKGIKGELQRTFLNPRLILKKESDEILFACKEGIKFSQIDKMLMNTYRAHIRNMFEGVTKGYTAKLKICSGHFPMTVSLEGRTLSIKNFLGEKVPRKVLLKPDVTVKIEGEIIHLRGLDKESVGQVAASIEQGTRITNRDRRIFQDGCYIISKPGDEHE